jgi:Fe-S cluster assembly ATPase SufC
MTEQYLMTEQLNSHDIESELKKLDDERIKLIVEQNTGEQYRKQEVLQNRLQLLISKQQQLTESTQGHEERVQLYTAMKKRARKEYLVKEIGNDNVHDLEDAVRNDAINESKYLDYTKKLNHHKNIVNRLGELAPNNVLKCPWCTKAIEVGNDQLLQSTIETERVSNKRKRTRDEHKEYMAATNFLSSEPITCCVNNIDAQKRKQRLSHVSACNYELLNIEAELLKMPDTTGQDFYMLQERVKKDSQDLCLLSNTKREIDGIRIVQIEPVDMERVCNSLFENKKRCSELKRALEIHRLTVEHKKMSQLLKDMEQKTDKSVDDKKKIAILNTCWLEAKTLCVENIVKTLQYKVNKIASQLFINPIAISVSCWKGATKTRGEKAGFEIFVNINNRNTNICDLSGGEKSRVSIAFSCALAEMQNSTLLMLDESLSGLDYINLSKTLNALRLWTAETKTTILAVSHLAINGAFDAVINLQDKNSVTSGKQIPNDSI